MFTVCCHVSSSVIAKSEIVRGDNALKWTCCCALLLKEVIAELLGRARPGSKDVPMQAA